MVLKGFEPSTSRMSSKRRTTRPRLPLIGESWYHYIGYFVLESILFVSPRRILSALYLTLQLVYNHKTWHKSSGPTKETKHMSERYLISGRWYFCERKRYGAHAQHVSILFPKGRTNCITTKKRGFKHLWFQVCALFKYSILIIILWSELTWVKGKRKFSR